ncbi:pyruvate dehydrogenase E1 component beta subunit [Scopulibacillus darangshiensis]|uniref:Pyruvate dehydrogenase E1 component beta subunit n=1 Tax=Scopulibacillus darangshiensis TaxID=442528 RepID=A0A4R2P4X6_9BACL|nr:alpha-ketoacid dehydrogenase subunit beta [Scopulibacillus darangshiensis]TCP29238.1 pyruvate dehydrogenase E1 component beta subunit [Scopulibacillus darangshiensis]
METATQTLQKQLTLIQAITDALDVMLSENEDILVLGQDVGQNGGVFRATEGLYEKYGEDRIIDTPLAESGIIGTSIGMAVNGLRPVAEIQFFGFIYPAFNQIMTHASRIRSRTLGRFTVPMVIRTPYGAGVRAPEIHSDSMEALFTHMPGIKVVVPSNPYDAKGLLIASIEDPDPVLFLEPMKIYRAGRKEVPEGKYTVPLGKGNVLKDGEDVSLFTWGAMVPLAMKAAEQIEKEQGICCDVIDLRTLYPLDRDLIRESVEKTGRVVILHEAHQTGGVSGDIISLINDTETAFLSLKAPIEKVTGFDVPVPMFSLEDHYLPKGDGIKQKIEHVYNY